MATYVVLANFTDQGLRAIKDSPQRAEVLKALAEKSGVKVRDIFWTFGQTEIVVAIAESDNDVAVTALTLAISQLGNVKAQTLRAYDANEIREIISKMP
ncbi:MAG: GYD domain-containing protein [Mesorhizobium sp.]|jgi:uncharacterized protein with GYD domain